MATRREEFRQGLEDHKAEFGVKLDAALINRLVQYYELLTKWNPRLHLVAPCSPREFATRHLLESLLLVKHLPLNASVIDIGSGGGLPIIPCLLVRDDLRATLIESSRGKGVFLREALRTIHPANRTKLIVSRFEEVKAPSAAFVTSRALDKFGTILPELIAWAPKGATFLVFGGPSLADQLKEMLALTIEKIPQSERRLLLIGRRT